MIPRYPKSQITKAMTAIDRATPGRESISQIINRKIKISQRFTCKLFIEKRGTRRTSKGPYPINQKIISSISIRPNT